MGAEALRIRVLIFASQLVEEVDVAYRQLQSVQFGQSLLVRKSWNVSSQHFERVVYRLHSLPFPQVSGLALLDLLLRTLASFSVAVYSSPSKVFKSDAVGKLR